MSIPRDAREVFLGPDGDPIAFTPKEGLALSDVQRGVFFGLMDREAVDRLRARAAEKTAVGYEGAPFDVVFIDVDDPTWTQLVDRLMPGYDWAAIRARGERPVARGVVPRKLLEDVVERVYPAASGSFSAERVNVVVLAFGGASVLP